MLFITGCLKSIKVAKFYSSALKGNFRHMFNPVGIPICRNLSKQKYNSMKYILVTGGVISGIGKGVIASSLGTILKSSGVKVTSIKIDPYINIDAGTFSPYEHGKL